LLFQELVRREPVGIVGEIGDLLPQQEAEWIPSRRRHLSPVQAEETG
jgi:hypothetical protein